MHFITAADFASTRNEKKTPNNEISTPFNLILQYNYTQGHDVTTRTSFKSAASLWISLIVTNYVNKDIFLVDTQKQMDRSTVTVTEPILLNSTNLMYVYIIPLTGIFLFFIVVSTILVILHRKTMCPNTKSTRRLHIKTMNIELDRKKMSMNTTNQTDTNNSHYEIINFDSDDSESIVCLEIETPFETSNQQPALSPPFISKSNVIIDSDGYQCPISIELSEKSTSTETSLNNYLTVVENA